MNPQVHPEKCFWLRHPQIALGPCDLSCLVDTLIQCQNPEMGKVFFPGLTGWTPLDTFPEILEICSVRKTRPEAEASELVEKLFKTMYRLEAQLVSDQNPLSYRFSDWDHIVKNPLVPPEDPALPMLFRRIGVVFLALMTGVVLFWVLQ
jgi:hypothetical protein